MSAPVAEIMRYFGFKEETVRGTAETSAEMHCDAMSVNPGMPDEPEMDYEGSMGRGRTLHRPGYYVSTPSAEFGTDIKILARMLYFALGNEDTVVSEGAGDTLTASKVWYYSASGNVHSNETTDFNSATADDVNVPGHAEAEVDDFLAIGYKDPFTSLTITTGTAKTDTSTLVWEYWDGSDWTTLDVTDGTVGFTEAGAKTITFTEPGDWTSKKLSTDTSAYFYVRVRCSAFTSADVQGKISQGTLGVAPDIATKYIYSTNSVLLPSFTGFFGLDIDEHIVSGCVADKIELNAEEDFLTISLDMKGQTPTLDDLKTKSELTTNDDYPLAFYEVDLHIREYGSSTPWGATTLVSSDVKKLKMSIENNTSEDDGKRIGSRFPGYIPAAARNIGLAFDYQYLTNDYIKLLWGSEDGPQEREGSTEVEMMIAIDAGRYGYAQIELPRVIVAKSPLESSGRDPIVQTVEVYAYQEDYTFTGSAGETTVNTDMFTTLVLNYSDTTIGFDGPAWAES
jgi:hypothetical protein